MASSDTSDSELNIEEDPASASFMQKNYSDEPEEGKEEEDPACQTVNDHTLVPRKA